jgi:hypothetical protein
MKKAQVTSTLAVLIIGLAIAVILVSAWGIYAQVIKSKTDIEACRLSIIGKSNVKLGGKSPLELKCPRNYITFFKDHIVQKTSGREDVKKVRTGTARTDKFKELNADIVFQVVAEELRQCWYKVGEGKFIPFDQKVASTSSICLVCSIIDFDVESKTFSGFNAYLNDNRMPGSESTYLEYLTREVYERQRFAPFVFTRVVVGREGALRGIDEIDTDQTYYVMYNSFNPTLIKWNFVDDFREMFGGSPKDEIFGELFMIPADSVHLLPCGEGMLYN